MRKLFLVLPLLLLLFACNSAIEKDNSTVKYDEIKKEVEDLKIKLAATEAQLLNVQTELSKYSNKDTIPLETNQ